MDSSTHLQSTRRSQNYIDQLAALLFSIILVVCIDLLTNSLNIQKFTWDFKYYIDMAEHGVSNNPNLRAPFAYRYATPWLSSTISHLFHVSTENGFRSIAYIGAISQLFLVFVFSRYLGARIKESFVIMLAIAFSMYHIKFLMFDVYRPDHLAYPLMIIAILLLLKDKLFLCVLVSLIGMFFREFLIIPSICVIAMLFIQNEKDIYKYRILYSTLIVCALAIVIVLPRLFIHVSSSTQYLDPVNNSTLFLYHLVSPILSVKRDFNMLFCLLSYVLPTLCLLTASRWNMLKQETRKYYVAMGLYSFLVVLLTLYGGTDIYRFVTYLFIPQLIILSIILIKGKPHWLEIVIMLLIMASYNRVFLPIPMNSRNAYLNWYGGHSNRVNLASLGRFIELGLSVGVAVVARRLLSTRNVRIRDDIVTEP